MRPLLILAALAFAGLAAALFFFRSGDSLTPETFIAERDPDALLLDVRTPSKYAAGHLDGAVNVDLLASDFGARVATFDRDRTVYLYCGSGHRSGRAARLLADLGFGRAVNIGGYGALKDAGAPVAAP